MYTHSIQGIRHHVEMMSRHARKLEDIEKADLPGDIVAMMIAKQGVGANVGALKTALSMQDSILDLLA